MDRRVVYNGLLFHDLEFYEGNIELDGYFQSEKYFLHCKDEIKKLFLPSNEVVEHLKNYEFIFSEKEKTFIQLRTYGRSFNDDSAHRAVTSEFLERAMSDKTHPDKLYVVTADNFEIAKSILPTDKNYYFIENEPNYINHFIMRKFDSFIISGSTFGWWGAYLSESENPNITILKDWFSYGKSLEHLNKNDIIPDIWKKI